MKKTMIIDLKDAHLYYSGEEMTVVHRGETIVIITLIVGFEKVEFGLLEGSVYIFEKFLEALSARSYF